MFPKLYIINNVKHKKNVLPWYILKEKKAKYVVLEPQIGTLICFKMLWNM